MGDAAGSGGGVETMADGLPTQAGDSGGFSMPSISGAGASSIAALGLSAFSGIEKAKGTKAADDVQEQRATRAAAFGMLLASLTNAVTSENLNTMLSNIDVIRTAAKADPTSPTGAAIEEHTKMISDRQRTASLLSINSQVREDEASAAYFHKAGLDAVANANLMAGLTIPATVSKGFGA